MLTALIKEGTAMLLQNREGWGTNQNIVNNLTNSFKASNGPAHATVAPFRDAVDAECSSITYISTKGCNEAG